VATRRSVRFGSISTQPTGTVTFLFTDIEGSTRLLQQYPDRMREVLARSSRTASGTSYGFVLVPLVTIVVAATVAGESITPAFLVGALRACHGPAG